MAGDVFHDFKRNSDDKILSDAKDNLDSKLAAELLSVQTSELPSRIAQQWDLLKVGASSGFQNRIQEILSNPGVTAIEVLGTASVAAGLTELVRAGGKYRNAAEIAITILGIAGTVDIARRSFNTGTALGDTWVNPQNFEHNKTIVAQNVGAMLVDYPMSVGSGLSGIRAVRHSRDVLEKNIFPLNNAALSTADLRPKILDRFSVTGETPAQKYFVPLALTWMYESIKH